MTDADDDTFSIMADHENDEKVDTRSWHVLCVNPQLQSRIYEKSDPSFFEDDATTVPSFYGDDDEEESFAACSEDWDYESNDGINDDISVSHVSIHTPLPDDPRALMFPNGNGISHIVEGTPEPSTNNGALQMISLPQIPDIQRQVDHTLQRLACSMRRSDETRTFLKRQRLHYQYIFKELTSVTKEGENSSSQHDDHTSDDNISCTKLSQPPNGPAKCRLD